MVLSPPQSLNTSFSPPPDLNVSDLIEDNSISWNSYLIRLPFFPRDDRLVFLMDTSSPFWKSVEIILQLFAHLKKQKIAQAIDF